MKKIFLAFLALLLPCQHSAASVLTTEQKTPAAWVWRVTSENRLLYLVGEIHVFLDINEDQIDFEFGKRVFNASTLAFTEAISLEAFPSPVERKLSDLLGLTIWKNLEKTMKSSIAQTNFSSTEKETMLKKVMEEFDNLSPILADASLRNISTRMYARSSKKNHKTVPGLSSKLRAGNLKNLNAVQISTIEKNELIDEVWRKNCNSSDMAQQLIEAALSFFEFDTFWNTNKVANLQKIFRDSYLSAESGEELIDYWLENYPGSRTLLACNVLPRNLVWKQKINDLLQTKGDPVSIFVGISHLSGKAGLIQSLKNDGAYKIERIYSLPNDKKPQ